MRAQTRTALPAQNVLRHSQNQFLTNRLAQVQGPGARWYHINRRVVGLVVFREEDVHWYIEPE
jgi:hypothetical protein